MFCFFDAYNVIPTSRSPPLSMGFEKQNVFFNRFNIVTQNVTGFNNHGGQKLLLYKRIVRN